MNMCSHVSQDVFLTLFSVFDILLSSLTCFRYPPHQLIPECYYRTYANNLSYVDCFWTFVFEHFCTFYSFPYRLWMLQKS